MIRRLIQQRQQQQQRRREFAAAVVALPLPLIPLSSLTILLLLPIVLGPALSAACVPAGNPFAKPAKSEPVVWPQVVLFGDSLTEWSFSADGGWGAVLAQRLKRRTDVVARGFCAYTSRKFREITPAVLGGLDVARIRVLTVFLGTNDAADVGVPLDEYVDNLTWIVQYLGTKGVDKSKIVLITPPKCDGERFGQPTRDERTRSYAAACVQVAQRSGCGHVDIYNLMETNYPDTWKTLLIDGVHFTAQGSQVVADAVWNAVEPRVGHLPFLFPDWCMEGVRSARSKIVV